MRRLICTPVAAGLLAVYACAPGMAGREARFVAPAAFADADVAAVDTLAPGLVHVHIRDARGPWSLHVVEADAARCRPALEARKPPGRLSARATTTALAGGALLAINADFFRLPGGTPVGAHVSSAVPLIGATDWPVFAVTAEGRWRGGVARTQGVAWSGRDSARIVQINRPSIAFTAYPGTPPGLTLFTGRADPVPPDTLAHRVLLRLLDGDARAGRGLVVRSGEAADSMMVGSDAAAILAYGAARDWARRRAAGDTVAWRAAVVIADGSGGEGMVVESVGAFPELLRAGADVLGTQTVREDFGLRRHPRTAIGWSADEARLFLVVVDGRQSHSDGMSLPELTWVFRRLGTDHALNLDGGGSTALVVRGTLANRPSDAEGERAVGNALALVRCQAGPGR